MSSLRTYVLRGVICLLVIIIYFYAWRPLRSAITQKVIYPQLTKTHHPSYRINDDGVALSITFPWQKQSKTIQYRPQAGLFFLVCLLTFVIIAADGKYYLLLAGLHVFGTIITGGLMLASKNGWPAGFILVDFIASYLTPVLTLMLAVWVIALKKGNMQAIK